MGLGIENATIGVDANNVQTALNNLNTNVIGEAIDKMTQGMSTLRDYVDASWVGNSAEQFKKNMESDKDKIIQELRNTFDVLKSELNQIVNAMEEKDQEIVKARGE